MLILSLFFSFVQVGLFSVGGGYAAVPLIQNQVVDLHHWITMAEFTDLLTIAEMTPGPIAINSATFVGIRIAGLPGALAASLGCILPSLVIVTLIGWLYRRYRQMNGLQLTLSTLRPGVVALIASAGLTLLLNAVFPGGLTAFVSAPSVANIDMLSVILFAVSLTAIRRFRKNPILVMIGSGAVYTLFYLIVG